MNLAQRGRRVRARMTPPIPEGEWRRTAIPDTEEGIEFEVDRMIEYVRHYSGDGDIVRIARRVVDRCPDKDKLCESRELYKALKRSTRFVLDPTKKEAIQSPRAMLREIQERGVTSGDCDELATLFATMISAIGHRPRFVFGGRGMGWQHVWVQDGISGKWIHFDLAEKLPAGRFLKFPEYGVAEIWK